MVLFKVEVPSYCGHKSRMPKSTVVVPHGMMVTIRAGD